jgi:hypothetical protein
MWHRIVPPSWEARLAQLTPRSETATWLKLAWLSGDPWEPAQRWCVYEMVPLRMWWGLIQGQRARGLKLEEVLEYQILLALQGPNPRELGHYNEVLQRYITEADCTRQEWELFRETAAIPKLFWIIQGTRGGHRRHWTPLERKFSVLAGGKDAPPAPGELPYAEFDERVLTMLARRERLQGQRGFLGANEEEYQQGMKEFRRQLVEWIVDQQREVLENHLINLEGVPTSSAKEDDPTEAIERRTQRFIETGSIYPKPQE